jgi:Fe-S cluster assembly iron-binding protein IscA
MKCKITRNAAKMIEKHLAESEGRKLRVYITHSHGDHAHYDLSLDDPKDNDEVVTTDKGIEVLLEQGQELLDGVKIDYLYFPQEGFVITNPSKGNHGDH